MADVDFAVIGGGPAGAAIATLLSVGGARVALVEATDFSRFRAGEALGLEAQRCVGRLGFQLDGDPSRGSPSTPPVSTWGTPKVRTRSTLISPEGVTRIVDRQWLDRALFNHAGLAGAALYSQARTDVAHRRRGRWHFRVQGPARTVTVSTPTVIEATGRNGRSVFAPDGRRWWADRLVGIAVVRRDDGSADKTSSVDAIPEGWVYRTPLPGRRWLTMLFTDADVLASQREAVIRILQHHADPHIAGFPSWWRTPVVFDARTSVRRVAVAEGWFAVGDALIAVDPLSGSGLASALLVAERAASWALQFPTGERDIPEWLTFASEGFNRHLRERVQVYRVEHRWPDRPFWRRRQKPPMVTANPFDAPHE